jgi:hypothetical protein
LEEEQPSTNGRARRYVVARWAELGDRDAPWWTLSQGIGIRLRLKELLDIARARNEGAALDRAVAILREEARAALLRESSFLAERHPPIAQQIRAAVEVEKTEPLPRGGLNFSIIEAAFEHLEGPELREAIIDELCARAGKAEDFPALAALDELIELLDAELAYDGYSAPWRYRVACDARDLVIGGAELGEAIRNALRDRQAGWPKLVRILVPIDKKQTAAAGAVTALLDSQDVSQRLKVWLEGAPVAEGFELEDFAFNFDIDNAADVDAAVKRANEWLEKELALYSLQGGELEPAETWLMIDEAAKTQTVKRPRPLKLSPHGLDRHASELKRDPTSREPGGSGSEGQGVMADALVQLAQARRGSDGVALSDIWTVIEAVFAGAATEPRHLAGEVMSELLEYLYPLALLDWLSVQLEAAGLKPAEGVRSGAAWALDQFEHNSAMVFEVIEAHGDPLAYVRAKSLGRWSGAPGEASAHMTAELTGVSKRCARVATRAYLVRNFQVHRAQPQRATALAVTLPVFAEISRVALGYVAAATATRPPITTAKLAMMGIRQVASDFEQAKAHGAPPLRHALGADLREA